MFENIIRFKANKKFIENNKDNLPIPAKLNIPKWFKNLEHSLESKTVKGCIPFLDTLTSGYILKMPVDYHIEHNVSKKNIKNNTGFDSPMKRKNDLSNKINLNYSGEFSGHPAFQLGKSPLLEKNKNCPVHKILNPWIIETPPGYSTLFTSPLNNSDDRFSILSGIVDTDSYKTEINFPFIVNGDKYENLVTTIERGTPYVQLIPFKRDSWKMKIQAQSDEKRKENIFFQFKYLLHDYKKQYWSKKTWK